MKKPELVIFGIDGGSPATIRKFVSEGKLPNFARLMEQGVFFDDCMPAYPTITPTCWGAITTGAVPSVSGALCQDVHPTGTHPLNLITPYHSSHIYAERFWEAAARKGKRSLIFNVPTSGPAKCENVLQVMGGTSVSPDRGIAKSKKYGYPQQFFSNDGNGAVKYDVNKEYGGGDWVDLFGENQYVDFGDGSYCFRTIFASPAYDPKELEPIEWTVLVEKEGLRVGETRSSAEKSPLLHHKEWSPVMTLYRKDSAGEEIPFHFRAYVEKFEAETGRFRLFVSGTVNWYREVTPASLAKEIAAIPEIAESDHLCLFSDPYNLDKYFTSEGFAVSREEQVLAHCVEKYQPDIVFDYYSHTDTVNHRFSNFFQKVDYNYEKYYDIAVDAQNRVYALLDAHLGWILDHLVDETTTVAVVSDHGAIGFAEWINVWNVLEKAGLVTYAAPADNPKADGRTRPVDWEKTKAYPVGSCYVNVNLQGREPTGSVPPEEYGRTVTAIKDALHQNFRAANGEICCLAFAVEGYQGGFVGHGEELNGGDVLYGLHGGPIAGHLGGAHGQQIPSGRSLTGTGGDIRSLCLMSGPKFRKNATLTRPTDLTDFAPTLCYALGYPQPKDATGGVVFQAYLPDEQN